MSENKRRQLPDPSDPRAPSEGPGERRERIPDDPLTAAKAAAEQLRKGVSKRRQHLSETKRAMLARRLRGRSQKAPAAVVIPRRPAQEPAPLSFAQERLWFLEQLMPGKPAYNVPLPLRLHGRLQPAALAASFAEILRRHEVLRATFRAVDGKPIMTFSPPAAPPLPLVDLTALPTPAREQHARCLKRAEAWRTFDLARGPLVRLFLLRLDAEDHLVMFNTHHIVFDGWSWNSLARELASFYQAFCTGRRSPLEELPIQYADFAHWQRQWLQGEILERQLSYWKRQLAGAPPVLELPWDRPRPAVRSFRGKWPPVALPRDLSESLAALGRRQEATLYMTLLAAFNALLARYTGQEDIVVGSPIAGRNHQEIENLIGLFLNTLVLRTDLSGGPTFRELLARVRQVAVDAYAHQEVPFERLVVELEAERDLSTTPLFQVMFDVQNAPEKSPELPALTLIPATEPEAGAVKFDLGLSLAGNATGVVGELEYSTDLFDDSTIRRFLAHFKRLLRGIVADPDRQLRHLPWWTRAERHHLLAEYNDTVSAERPGALLHERFARRAGERPEAVAVVFEGRQWSYRELDRRANQLAHHLHALGVGRNAGTREVLVGICLDPSPEMVMALLAVLKAGGGWLPLDPKHPRRRLAFMMADTRLGVLLTREHLLEVLPEHEARVVCLDRDRHAVAAESDGNPVSPAAAENVAYVIYTSGSTGRPKGVVVTHGNLASLVAAQGELLALEPEARVLQFFSLNFDASVWEIAMTLAAGAVLHLAPRDSLLPGAPLVEILNARQITTASLAPPVLAALPADSLPGVGTLVSGGEACPPELARRWSTGRRFYNLYGPTEITVCATVAHLNEGHRLSIGRPIANTRIYLVDRYLEPVPPGVPGELVIGGEGVTRGYLDRPALSAERFVPDPFDSRRGGGRLYRSGDLARFLDDGTIDFLGRIDRQVKIRGFRIELGEVEVALGRHPAVRESAVLMREDPSGDRRLIAYFVAAGEPAPAGAQIRDFLQETLPEYMVPSVFVLLDALPATPHGKVDRAALAVRALPAAGQSSSGLAPRDAVELRLARIWEELLGVQPVGVRSNFFEIGGHSLLAVRLMAQIRHHFGRDLPLAVLFQEGTIEHLAAMVRRQPEATCRRALVAIRPEGSRPPLFCVHPGGGHVLCYADLARLLAPEQPFYGLQVPEREGELFLTTLEKMATHYLEAMREVQPQGPYRLAGWSMGGLVAFEMARQLAARGERVARLVLIDAVLIDAQAPAAEASVISDAELALLFARDQAGILGQRLPISLSDVDAFATAEEVLSFLYAKMQAADLVPPGLELSHLRRLFETFRINIRATERYCAPTYAGRLVLFKARERFLQASHAPDLGWGELAKGGVEVHEIPGDHYSILRQGDIQTLADRLREVLDPGRPDRDGSVSESFETITG